MLVGLDLHVVIEVNTCLTSNIIELEHSLLLYLREVEGLGESEVDVLRLFVCFFV